MPTGAGQLMQVLKTKQHHNGPVNCHHEVILGITKEEADELRKALKLITKYEKAATSELGFAQVIKSSDWHMFGFAVKNDRVVVDVQLGACG